MLSDDMTLYYKYTSLPLYSQRIADAWKYASRTMSQQIQTQGADALLLRDPTSGAQRFDSRGSGSVAIEIENIAPYAITWGNVRDVVNEVTYWTCSSSLCDFEFEVENGNRIGRGRIYKI